MVSHLEEEVVLVDVAVAEVEEEAVEALATTKEKPLKVTSIPMNSPRRWKTGASAWENGARIWQTSTSREVSKAEKVVCENNLVKLFFG